MIQQIKRDDHTEKLLSVCLSKQKITAQNKDLKTLFPFLSFFHNIPYSELGGYSLLKELLKQQLKCINEQLKELVNYHKRLQLNLKKDQIIKEINIIQLKELGFTIKWCPTNEVREDIIPYQNE